MSLTPVFGVENATLPPVTVKFSVPTVAVIPPPALLTVNAIAVAVPDWLDIVTSAPATVLPIVVAPADVLELIPTTP